MKQFAMAVLIIGLGWTTRAEAQQWSPEQQEVIDTIEMCWDAWVDALEDATPDHFFNTCKQDPNALFWWTEEGAPNGAAWIRRNWDLVREVDDDWADMRPVNINIFGDTAIAYLYGYWRAHTPGGIVTTEALRTEVFQNRDGEWFFIGAQGTPATPADAEPYQ